MKLPHIGSSRQRRRALWVTALAILFLLGVTWASPSSSSGKAGVGSAIGAVSPAIVSAAPTPFPFCTAPACRPDEEYYCPGTCPGGCGTECATRTPTATVPSPPTPIPPPLPGPEGAQIALRLLFPTQGLGLPWQMLWTVVQWQDGFGRWHDVEGWRGTLDGVSRDGGNVIGQKTWWLAGDLFATGPYRWVVYRAPGGARVAASAPFLVPHVVGETQIVEVSP